MQSSPWRRRLGLVGLALLILSVPACVSNGHLNLFGYTSAPNYDTSIRTVYVAMAGNKTTVHGSLEFDVTREIIKEIQLKSPYRVVRSLSGADTELKCTIANSNKRLINQNQIGETREAQVGLVCEVIWLDRRPGHEGEVLSSPKRKDNVPLPLSPDGKPLPPVPVTLAPTAFYIPELGGSNASGQQLVIQQLATQIVSMMEISGTAWK